MQSACRADRHSMSPQRTVPAVMHDTGASITVQSACKAYPRSMGPQRTVPAAMHPCGSEVASHANYSGNFETMVNITTPASVVTHDQV